MIQDFRKQELNASKVGSRIQLLNIDFDLHTDGDEEFKQELIDLMKLNLQELQSSVGLSQEVFKKVCHKVKPTIIILNSDLLNSMIDDLNADRQQDGSHKSNEFIMLCNDIIKYLESEKKIKSSH